MLFSVLKIQHGCVRACVHVNTCAWSAHTSDSERLSTHKQTQQRQRRAQHVLFKGVPHHRSLAFARTCWSICDRYFSTKPVSCCTLVMKTWVLSCVGVGVDARACVRMFFHRTQAETHAHTCRPLEELNLSTSRMRIWNSCVSVCSSVSVRARC